MIVIVDDRSSVGEAYRNSFRRIGVSVSSFSSADFEGWVTAAADEDLKAMEAVLIGECQQMQCVADVVRRRSPAALIAMREERSLTSTLELFAEGVDDVVGKPCHVREIMARIEAIYRRARAAKSDDASTQEIRTFKDGREPLIRGTPMNLPRRELRILEFLVASRARRVTKAQIFNSVYGLFDQDIEENVVESHISKLRRRLRGRLGYDPIDLKRHLGYRLIYRPVTNDQSPRP